MKIERKGRITQQLIDVEHGNIIEYKGTPFIRTSQIYSNFGMRTIECCNLVDGTVENIPEKTLVSTLKAKVVIE